MRARGAMAGLVGAGLISGVAAVGTASTAIADVGVCSGGLKCRVVTHVDVNGDGHADTVAIARRGAEGARSGSVMVRVKTSPGRVVSASRRTSFWFGGLWQGAARIDGRPGRELVVGYTAGAHTLF